MFSNQAQIVMVKIVGILNITPDSFSDGGKFTDVDSAIMRVRQMIAEGADIIDVGAESTRPDAERITVEEEWQRLEKILPILVQEVKDAGKEISLDSYQAKTISKALELGIDYINDVSAFADRNIIPLIKQSGVKYILTHNLGLPVRKDNILPKDIDVVLQLKDWFEDKRKILLNSGIEKEKIIFDLGIGFGKDSAQSLELMQRAYEFQDLDCEIYVGHSRKSFFKILPFVISADKDIETAYISARLAEDGVSYLRVHNVGMCKSLCSLAEYFA